MSFPAKEQQPTSVKDQDLLKHLKNLESKWESSIVARTDVAAFSGGALNPGTMANEDSRGTGPEGAFKIGRKTVYPVANLIDWMSKRASI